MTFSEQVQKSRIASLELLDIIVHKMKVYRLLNLLSNLLSKKS